MFGGAEVCDFLLILKMRLKSAAPVVKERIERESAFLRIGQALERGDRTGRRGSMGTGRWWGKGGRAICNRPIKLSEHN